MRVICFVRINGFYVANRPQKTDTLLVVHHEKRVLDACAGAQSAGVCIGMGLPEAKAILGSRVAYLAWKEEEYRAAQEKWLDVCAEFSDVIEPVTQHEAYVALTGHPRPREVAERLCEELSARTGLQTEIGVAGCRWVAEVALWKADPSGEALLLPRRYVAALPPEALPIQPQHAQRLRFLGYRTLGQIAELELDTLKPQFENDAFAILMGAMGNGNAHVEALYPPDSIAARFNYDGVPDTREAFDNGIFTLCHELGSKLVKSDLYGEEATLVFEHEDGTVTVKDRTFTKPISNMRTLLNGVRLMTTQLPEAHVSAVRIRLPRLRAVERVQLELSGQQSKGDTAANAATALKHVKAVFGDDAVQLASEVKEPRWVQVRKAWRKANGWTWA